MAMTSLAQILLDAKKSVTGTDVKEDFVTSKILDRLKIDVSHDFEAELPKGTQAVIYTAAHKGPDNPMVIKAQKAGLSVYSHAEALAVFFNQKDGIAVCGVGGKSTVSAMLAFIFEKIRPESFSVGVGNIGGMNKTGQWLKDSNFFVAEADEYVIDPAARNKGQEIQPRFSYLKPKITVCTNLQFDHPDVYKDFNHTKQIYEQFFRQNKEGGSFVVNGDDMDLYELVKKSAGDKKVLLFGGTPDSDLRLETYHANKGVTEAKLKFGDKSIELKLKIPGKYNVMNAMAALLAAHLAGIEMSESAKALVDFTSTMRRFELIREKNGVVYYDDYAHHPEEIKAVLEALAEWYPNNRKIIAFQSHTFSRTKQLFEPFSKSFDLADKVLMIDIFASAREEFDESVSSDRLCLAINGHQPRLKAQNLGTISNLANYFNNQLEVGDVVMTLGAGDIYQVHDLVE